MTTFIEATLLRRISDLERWITTVEETGILEQTKAELLDFLRRELATEQGNLRRLRVEQVRELDKAYSAKTSKARVTLETGQPWPSGEGVGDGTQ